MQIDRIDRHLLRLLQEDAARPVSALAADAGISASACRRRIDRLEAEGVIVARRVALDLRALGYEVQVFLRVTLEKTEPRAFDDFIAEARKIPNVQSIETLLGRVDIRMDVVARDLAHYQQIYQERILALPHISDVEALMLVSELKNSEALAI